MALPRQQTATGANYNVCFRRRRVSSPRSVFFGRGVASHRNSCLSIPSTGASTATRNISLRASREEGSNSNVGESPEVEITAMANTDSSEPLLAKASSRDIDYIRTAFLFFFPALGGLLFGFDIGATSGAIVSLTSLTTSGTDWGPALSDFQVGSVVSSSLFGALVGSVGAFFVGDKLGRKKELLLAAGLYGLGAGIASTAADYPLLMAGRGLYGLAIGFAMHAAPAYIAETAPAKLRGLLISLKEAFIVGGILLGYLGSYFLVDASAGWRGMYGIAIPIAVAFGIGMLLLPESPRWLMLSGAGEDPARKALQDCRGNVDGRDAMIEADLKAMADTVQVNGSGSAVDFSKLLEKKNAKPLYIGLSLMFFQQITGQPSVLYYAAKIFQDAGFAGEQAATGVSVVLGGFKLLMTSVAAFSVDSLGRRPLLLWGVSGIVVSLITLGSVQTVLSGGAVGPIVWVNVVALLLYVGCYQISFGPVSWLLVGEVFPLEVRGQAAALATFVNFGTNFLVSLVLPVLQSGLGLGNTYFVFSILGMAAVFSIFATVPETKGKTLEEIEALWSEEDAEKGGV
ncbi:hypothetical protein BSKO_11324 [Bryopsis sp. KO-2023]|nr:hypothetical protein BSKO_11324 [Bryopsis sp. KO-2023]